MRYAWLLFMSVVFSVGMWLFRQLDDLFWSLFWGGIYGIVCAELTYFGGVLAGWWSENAKTQPPEDGRSSESP